MKRPEQADRTFSDLDDARIWLGHMDGTDDRTLADELNMSVYTLRERRGELTAPLVPPKIPKKPVHPRWTPGDVEFVRLRRREGCSRKWIGRQLGRTEEAVARQIKILRKAGGL